MSASTTASWWQYSAWVKNVARNMRITTPTSVAFETQIKTFIKYFWNPQTSTGTRPWLADKFMRLSVTAAASQYLGNIDSEPFAVQVKMVEVIGRDLKKIPITDAEKAQADALIALCQNRQYGTGPYFGGVIGSTVTIPS